MLAWADLQLSSGVLTGRKQTQQPCPDVLQEEQNERIIYEVPYSSYSLRPRCLASLAEL